MFPTSDREALLRAVHACIGAIGAPFTTRLWEPEFTPDDLLEELRVSMRRRHTTSSPSHARIDTVALAAEVGMARATLYRWTGDRERLVEDAAWAEAQSVANVLLHRSRRKSGLARIQAVCVDFIAGFGDNAGVTTFFEHERGAGLELLTRVNGGFRPRLVAWIAGMIRAEIDAGHYRAPADPELLADGVDSIGERLLHHGGDPDVTPYPASAGRMIAALLREPCD